MDSSLSKLSKSVTFEDDTKTKNRSRMSANEAENESGVNASQNSDEKFDPRKYMLPGTTQRDVEIWKELFDVFDKEGKGSLTPLDVRNAMLTIGYNAQRKLVYQMVSNLDTDESGGIEFHEFVKMMVGKPAEGDNDEDLLEVFRTYDKNNNGYITKEDLLQMSKELEEQLTEEEADTICREIDLSGEGKITPDEWIKFMRKQQYLG